MITLEYFHDASEKAVYCLDRDNKESDKSPVIVLLA